jgi:hypothetical protein
MLPGNLSKAATALEFNITIRSFNPNCFKPVSWAAWDRAAQEVLLWAVYYAAFTSIYSLPVACQLLSSRVILACVSTETPTELLAQT